jgi:hypothetical protein
MIQDACATTRIVATRTRVAVQGVTPDSTPGEVVRRTPVAFDEQAAVSELLRAGRGCRSPQLAMGGQSRSKNGVACARLRFALLRAHDRLRLVAHRSEPDRFDFRSWENSIPWCALVVRF